MQVIALGIVQGLAEFLPISSSGHIVIASALLEQFGDESLPKIGLTTNVALHVGTLVSILVVFRRELIQSLSDPPLLRAVVVATIPLALIYPLKDTLESAFESPLVAGCGLLVTAVLLLAAERMGTGEGSSRVSLAQAAIIGVFQLIAPCPGISRSGSTIAGALFAGVERRTAATFSFIIAIPAIAGGAAASLVDVIQEPEQPDWGLLLIGAIVSCLVGIAALRLMLNIVGKRRLWIFSIYCSVVGLSTIVWQLQYALTSN
ncbi:Undecaprenyl-diphosphatase [Stratiformator vulcanicus]|uniref:Undecaprenyl-diphosphatase n=1 Tax=Stratiformator vulcanicus TaxID=2527980 RepID=A0A517R2M9_9PLAN|nr:Undecaprenyl-diphosphatase [Stratiformator vulcanicus]